MGTTTITTAVRSLSWIPSDAIAERIAGAPFELGLMHHDPPPPDRMDGAAQLATMRDEDRFRFANVLSAWARVEDGRVVDADFADDAGVVMGTSTVRVGPFDATFAAIDLPAIQKAPRFLADGSVRLIQTCGGRTAIPAPRTVPYPPFVKLQSPLVWTTLELTIHPDGSSDVDLSGASAFPRHWVYDADGELVLKSGLTDFSRWYHHSFGARTPWGEEDSPTLATLAESALERTLSSVLMTGGVDGSAGRPAIRSLPEGTTLIEAGSPGDELYLLLDGVVSVHVDGTELTQLGPGAVLGERAVLEGGRRTSTVIARTPIRVAVAPSTAIDRDRLAALSDLHRREDDADPAPSPVAATPATTSAVPAPRAMPATTSSTAPLPAATSPRAPSA